MKRIPGLPVKAALAVGKKSLSPVDDVFCLISVHTPIFFQIGQITKLKRFAIGRLWLVGPVSQKIAVFPSIDILFGFYPNISSQTKSNQNWRKNAERRS